MKALLWVRMVAVGGLAFGLFAGEAWNPHTLIQPPQAAKEIADAATEPAVLFVGFPVLYRGAHIPNALLAGPASKPEGLAALKAAASGISRDRRILLYCGCCPFVKCPNVRPAFDALKEMGFKRIQVLVLDTNFHTDWVEKGYPVEKANPVSPVH